jgi:flagellar motor protein MotB
VPDKLKPRSHQPRMPRVERDEIVEVHEDENAHLWAVSYSDFLMALLSFFILFFSIDTPKRQQLIMDLASEFSQTSQNGAGGLGTSALDKGKEVGRLPASFMESLKGLDVSVDKEKESLVVNFPNDFFGPGKHAINKERELTIINFLSVVKPYKDEVNLYFEGHADSSPLTIHKSEIIVDNFVLSSLRASSGLLMAKQMGFSEKFMFIQAASSNLRNSRSLSIRIEPRKEVL